MKEDCRCYTVFVVQDRKSKKLVVLFTQNARSQANNIVDSGKYTVLIYGRLTERFNNKRFKQFLKRENIELKEDKRTIDTKTSKGVDLNTKLNNHHYILEETNHKLLYSVLCNYGVAILPLDYFESDRALPETGWSNNMDTTNKFMRYIKGLAGYDIDISNSNKVFSEGSMLVHNKKWEGSDKIGCVIEQKKVSDYISFKEVNKYQLANTYDYVMFIGGLPFLVVESEKTDEAIIFYPIGRDKKIIEEKAILVCFDKTYNIQQKIKKRKFYDVIYIEISDNEDTMVEDCTNAYSKVIREHPLYNETTQKHG